MSQLPPGCYPSIDPDACQHCARCEVARVCRWMAVIRFDRDEAPVIDTAGCRQCLACVDQCPFGALITTGISAS